MLKTLGLVAAVTLYIVNPAPAGPQAKTGDTCLPFDNNVVYKRDSGAIVNTGPGTQGFICPIQIIDNHCGNYCGDFYYQRQFHYASLGYTVPQGTTIIVPQLRDTITGSVHNYNGAKPKPELKVASWHGTQVRFLLSDLL
jgi:hypothetical protein